MKEAFDTATLLIALSPNPGTVHDRDGNVIADAKKRVEYLIETLDQKRSQVIIPAPVFSELLVRAANAANKYFEIITTSRRFKIEPFDARAAVEAADLMRMRLGTRKADGLSDPWPKVKFDCQIVAIAKVCQVSQIYSTDNGLISLSRTAGIPAVAVAGLPLRPTQAQGVMIFQKPDPTKQQPS